MLRVGLTGGIASGKSAVVARLAERGAVVIDSDVLAREVVAPGSEGLAAVVAEFGPAVLDAEGGLDRPALARIVFADDAARAALEQITHPLIRARSAAIESQAITDDADAIVVHDIPLLVEKQMSDRFDVVVVVEAPQEVRVARMVDQRGMSAEEASSRIAAQAGDAERRAVADHLIDNSGTRAELQTRVDELWEQALRPAAEGSPTHS